MAHTDGSIKLSVIAIIVYFDISIIPSFISKPSLFIQVCIGDVDGIFRFHRFQADHHSSVSTG